MGFLCVPYFFMLQQVLLDGKATGVSGKAAILPDNAVAGNNDGNRIAVIGHTHSAAGAGFADHDGHILVTACFSSGDGLQRLPYRCLKLCTAEIQGQIECFSAARKVFRKLAFRLFDNRAFL